MNPAKKVKSNSRSSSLSKKDVSKISSVKSETSKVKKSSTKHNETIPTPKSKSNKGATISHSKEKTSSKTKKSEKPKNDVASEAKMTKSVDTISRLINNSNEILAQQTNLLDKCEDLTKKITSSDIEIDRLLTKGDNEEFPNFLDKYGSSLNVILSRLKSHTDEVEEIKRKV